MTDFNDRVEVRDTQITIYYSGYYDSDDRCYSDLLDFLGDSDIITSPEIGQDVIVMSGEVYFFRHRDEIKLKNTSKVTLERFCSLEEYIDKNNQNDLNFMEWYY